MMTTKIADKFSCDVAANAPVPNLLCFMLPFHHNLCQKVIPLSEIV